MKCSVFAKQQLSSTFLFFLHRHFGTLFIYLFYSFPHQCDSLQLSCSKTGNSTSAGSLVLLSKLLSPLPLSSLFSSSTSKYPRPKSMPSPSSTTPSMTFLCSQGSSGRTRKCLSTNHFNFRNCHGKYVALVPEGNKHIRRLE